MSFQERTHYYDRSRNPITLAEYIRFKEDEEYTLVRADTLPDGKWIWTGWIGFDYLHLNNPRIFETIVFESEHQQEVLYTRRYASLDCAIIGHAEAILRYKKKKG